MVESNLLDRRFVDPAGFNGYTYQSESTITGWTGPTVPPEGFAFVARPFGAVGGRYAYGIAKDQVVRYLGTMAAVPPLRHQSSGYQPGDVYQPGEPLK